MQKGAKTLLIVSVLLILTFIVLSRTQFFSVLPFGFTTISLSNAQFTNSLPSLSCSQGWIMTVTQGGLGQSASGTISASEIASKSGVRPQYDLNIDMKWDNLAWEYPVKVDYTSKPVRYYNLVTWGCLLPPSDQDAYNKCGSGWIYYGKKSWSTTCFCVYETNLAGVTGYLDSCQVHSTSTITVSAGGQTNSATIDTRGQISQKIGNYVYVVWNGNLMKENCPSTSPYKTFYKDGTWNIGSNSYYQEYATAYDDTTLYLQQAYSGGSWDLNTLQAKIDNLKNKATRFVGYKVSFGNMIYGNIQSGTTTQYPYVEYGVTSDVSVPMYTFYVCADLLKIYQPQPKPQILSVTSNEFKTGETGYIYVQFKNIGDNGNFEVWATCNSPFQFIGTTKTVGLNAGETTQVSLPISASVSSSVSSSCQVYVKGAGTSNQVSSSVSVKANPQTYCQPNTLTCNPSLTGILKCNSAGSGYDLIQTCASDQICMFESGQPKCVNKGTTQTTQTSQTTQPTSQCGKIFGIFPDIFCEIKNFINQLRYVFTAIVFFVSLLFVKDFAVKPTRKKQVDWVGWVITFAIAGLLAYLTFLLWWIALIVLFVYLILKIMKPMR